MAATWHGLWSAKVKHLTDGRVVGVVCWNCGHCSEIDVGVIKARVRAVADGEFLGNHGVKWRESCAAAQEVADAMVIVTTNAQLYQEKWNPTSIAFNAALNYGESAMRSNVVGFVAAAALLTSVGISNAGSPAKLTDGQLDNITAGSASAAANVATTGALNYAGAVNTAVGANLAAAASPSAVGTAVTADLAVAGAFNNLLAASTSAASIAGTP